MTTTPVLPPDTLDRVREHLARSGATLTPEVVALALRDQGRPVGDAMVLAVHDRLRQDVLGAGPLEPLLRLPGVTDVLVNGPDRGLRRPGRRAAADRRPLRRRRRRAAPRAAAGRRRPGAGSTTRTPYVDAPAGRRHPLPRRPRAAVPARHRAVAAGAPGAGLHARGAGRAPAPSTPTAPVLLGGSSTPGWRSWSAAAPDGQDHVAVGAALAGRPRPSGSSSSRTPASCGPTTRTSSASRPGRPTSRAPARSPMRDARPAGPADAARPAGRRRGAAERRCVDLLAALNTGHEGGCGTVHANSARDVPARHRGARRWPRACRRRRCTASWRPPSTPSCTWPGGRDGRRRVAEIAVLRRGDDGLVRGQAGDRLRRRRGDPRVRRRRAARGAAGGEAGADAAVLPPRCRVQGAAASRWRRRRP